MRCSTDDRRRRFSVQTICILYLEMFPRHPKRKQLLCSIYAIFCSSLTPGLVQTAAANVAHPLDDIVVRVVDFRFEYFQITDLQNAPKLEFVDLARTGYGWVYLESGWSKWNFKVHGNWWSCPLFLRISFKQFDFGRQLSLLHTSHTLDPSTREGIETGSVGFLIMFSQAGVYSLPNNCIFRRLIFGLSFQTDQLHTGCIEWRRNFHFDFLSE